MISTESEPESEPFNSFRSWNGDMAQGWSVCFLCRGRGFQSLGGLLNKTARPPQSQSVLVRLRKTHLCTLRSCSGTLNPNIPEPEPELEPEPAKHFSVSHTYSPFVLSFSLANYLLNSRFYTTKNNLSRYPNIQIFTFELGHLERKLIYSWKYCCMT